MITAQVHICGTPRLLWFLYHMLSMYHMYFYNLLRLQQSLYTKDYK